MIEVQNLKVGYGESEVIPDLSFSLGDREILGVMGRNGMGKTTLFKSLIGILPASGGQISIGDVSLTKLPPYRRVAKGLAYVPQGRMIFPSLTVEENLKVGLETSGEKSVPDYIYELFPVLAEMAERKGGNLSGGQQQQLAIGRALVTDPQVLLLDEPTEGIQPSIIKEIALSLKRIRDLKGISIIVAEQVLSFTLEACDRFAVINAGEFVHEVSRKDVDAEKISSLLAV